MKKNSSKVYMASFADDTPEGKSIIELAQSKGSAIPPTFRAETGYHFIKFTAETRSSGVNLPDGNKDPQRRF
jgi:K+-transporting ATPase ATPase B chain